MRRSHGYAVAATLAVAASLGRAGAEDAPSSPPPLPDDYRSYLAHVAAADGAARLGEPGNARRWLDDAPPAHRGWEWRFLDASADESLAVFEPGLGELMSVTASPDGRRLAVTAAAATAAVLDAASGRTLRTLAGFKGQVFRADFHPTEDRLLTAGQDAKVRLWDLATGEVLRTFEGHGGSPVGAARFLGTGDRAASCAWERTDGPPHVLGTVLVWDAATGEVRSTLRGGVKPLVQMALFPDRRRFAVASWDFCAFVFDPDAAGDPAKHAIPDEGVYRRANDVAVSADGTRIAVTSSDETARVFDAATASLVATLREHRAEVWGAAFSPDGATLATSGADCAIRLWDTSSWKQVAVLRGHRRSVSAVAFLPERRLVSASADGTVRLWDADPRRYGGTRVDHSTYCYASRFTPDGRRLVTFGHDGVVLFRDAVTGAEIARFQAHDGGVGVHVALSADGRRFATTSWDKSVRVFDADTLESLARLDHDAGVGWADFSPDGRLVAAGTQKGSVRVWSVEERKEVASLEAGGRPVSEVRFRPDGGALAAACGDGTVRVWMAPDWSPAVPRKGHTAGVRSVGWSPGGGLLSLAADGRLRSWDAKDPAVTAVVATVDGDSARLAVSPDGRTAAVGADGIHLIDLVRGTAVLRVPFTDGPWDMGWSPDGTRLVACSSSGPAVVLETRRLRDRLDDVRAAAARAAAAAERLPDLLGEPPSLRRAADAIRADASLAADERAALLDALLARAAADAAARRAALESSPGEPPPK